MASSFNQSIPLKGLQAFFDVSNPRCVDATQTISATTQLQNLAPNNPDLIFDTKPGAVAGTYAGMSFVLDNGHYVYEQDALNGADPGWSSDRTIQQPQNFTFHIWFKYTPGATQTGENIYGGGFSGRTSFYLAPGGGSANHGVLRYSDAGSGNSYSHTANYGGNDGNWHLFSCRDYGEDGNRDTDFWLDGEFKQRVVSNSSHIIPDSRNTMTWGSWSVTYGNFGGRTNMYLMYNRTQSGKEIKQVFEATRSRFGV